MLSPRLIEGGLFSDERGELRFVNEFDLSEVVRFYQITHFSTAIVRAWQGHEKEQKWFYCLSGSFIVNLIELDNLENPSPQLPPQTFILTSDKPCILHVPGGFANGFKALDENSVLMVYSDKSIEEAKNDDLRWDADYFVNSDW